MGRKSIAVQRREEILDAFEICIGELGFAASSTHKIAEKAGMKQPMIAHYFGNRDSLVIALIERMRDQYMDGFQHAISGTTGTARVQKLLDYLFGPEILGKGSKGDLLGQLLSASINDKNLRERIREMYDFFMDKGKAELLRYVPDAGQREIDQCCYGIQCLVTGNDALLSIDIQYENRLFARKCAKLLLEDLEKGARCHD